MNTPRAHDFCPLEHFRHVLGTTTLPPFDANSSIMSTFPVFPVL